ncbi:hypothetical protein [Streptomyces noursei]|uniref:hypothetical protein n=1 Tax=Streptomyces noursei TaxID=1971 RepID=UPI0019B72637|nr:hypothetical protein [Streptomyces noursei]MCZ1020414.1 hypothetical protein [Streptomyces noursei]GGX14037.1 hypothetical protein GCM10010341_39480 [Streptomyces noursei]
MNTPSGPPPMTELSGGEALWLLEGSTLGQLAYVQREQAVVRPARHVLAGWTHGPHDTLPRFRPQTITGFRLAGAEA